MAARLAKKGRQLATKVLFFQSLVAVVVIIVLTMIQGQSAGLSAAYGAIICLVPNVVFAHFAFKYAGASQNRLVVRSFNQGSKLKLALTIFLFVVAFKWLHAEPLPLFGSFAITIVAQWVAILGLRNND